MSTTAVKREGFDAPTIDAQDVGGVEARRSVRLACLAVLGVCGAGLLAIPRVSTIEFTAWSLFFEQYARIEFWPLTLVAVFAMVTLVTAARTHAGPGELAQLQYRPWLVATAAALVTLIALLGIRFVFHGYLFADDEYSAWFQAIVFAHGKVAGQIPRAWCSYAAALTPTSIYSSARTCSWWLSYLPLHSLVQAPFIKLGVGRFGVPLLAGLSVWLVASIARKLWPERPTRAYVAALFMVTSTQILFMSMTMFSMPTHLFFSLVWLWLYVDDRRWSNVLLPFVGLIAIGVHSPFPHLLLIPPFVVRYLWHRRFAMFAYVALVYSVGLMFWYGYINGLSQSAGTAAQIASPTATAAVAVHVFQLPNLNQGLVTSMHVALIASWNAPLAIILAIIAMLSWRRLDAFSRDAVLSVIIILVARLFKPTPQGQGWGYRYVYDGLASLALLSAVGADVLAAGVGRRRALALLLSSSAAALLVQLPMRGVDVAGIVGPYRRSYEWMAAQNYDAVVFPSELTRWGNQLVRNQPFLTNRPKVLDQSAMTAEQRTGLLSRRDLKVLVLNRDSLNAHDFPAGIIHLGSLWILK